MAADRTAVVDPNQELPAWIEALAKGKEPLWTPLACGFLILVGWLGPRIFGLPKEISLLCFAGAYVFGGALSVVRSVRSLSARRLDIDLLMLLSALGAAAIGEVAEGAVLLFLFSLSNALESRALRRTTHEIEALMKLHPEEALLLDPGGVETLVPVDSLRRGQTVLVRPGGRIPVDGSVVSGQSEVDQSAITGESIPVAKSAGDLVLAGSINSGGALEIRVEKPASESTLARIIALVEGAREAKAPTQRFIDRFEQGYAATVIFAAVAAVLLAMAFGESFRPAMYRAMTLLVVASPCAVVISTPATILAALAHAARRGLLFKGGAPLEDLATIDCVAFDKTGTLTEGAPTVVEVVAAPGSTPEEVLTLAAAVERLSEHHLARAIVDEAETRGLDSPRARGLKNSRGEGAVAEVEGHLVAVGRAGYVSKFPDLAGSEVDASRMKELENRGLTLVHVAGSQVCGVIGIDDAAREDAVAAIRKLEMIGIDRTVLLTGDNRRVAERVANQVGVSEFQAELLPEDKVQYLNELNGEGHVVAMVGDGVNDAPALASARVGVAMGIAGTDVALETADLVLVRDRLEDLPYAVRLSRRSLEVVRQNLAFACAVIAVLVVITLIRGLPLPIGVVGHEGSTLLVVLNGLRLLRPLPDQ